MRSSFILFITFFISGCNTNNIDYALARAAGNKPAQFFHFSNPNDANNYTFYRKDFNLHMPLTYTKDWRGMSGWTGANIYGGIGIGVANKDKPKVGEYFGYGINISSHVGNYGEMQRAIENRDIGYIRSHIRIDNSDKLSIENHGKENYICRVMEYTKKNYKSAKFKGYTCYKFNPSRTKYKSVNIKLIYTKSPNLPSKYKHLARQYTYADLKRRAKRMLDSLYIKDGW